MNNWIIAENVFRLRKPEALENSFVVFQLNFMPILTNFNFNLLGFY